MRHEASFLQDILAASKKIEGITSAPTEERFLADEVLPAAVLHHPHRDRRSNRSLVAGTQGAEPWRAMAGNRGCSPQDCARLLRFGLGDSLERRYR